MQQDQTTARVRPLRGQILFSLFKCIVLISFPLFPVSVFAAIAHDTPSQTALHISAGGTQTVSLTVAASAETLLCGTYEGDTGTDNMNMTYNGASMTLATTSVYQSSGDRSDIFYKINPSSGANNLIVNGSNGMRGACQAYSGTNQSTAIDVMQMSSNANAASVTLTKTTTVANDWAFGVGFSNTGGLTAGTNATLVTVINGAQSSDFDNSGSPTAFATAGSNSIGLTGSGGSFFNANVVFFQPAAAAPASSPIKVPDFLGSLCWNGWCW